MHRREFLKTTGAAAAAGLATGTATREAAGDVLPAPQIVTAPRLELVLATPSPLELPGVGEAARRLAKRITAASEGTMRLLIDERPESSVELIATGQADLTFANEVSNRDHDRAFTFFGGLPGAAGLMPDEHCAWLAGGAQALWDELAAGFGMKPLLAGHTGVMPGLWSRTPFVADARRLDGLAVFTRGLGNDAAAGLGAEFVHIPAAEIPARFAAGTLDMAEWAGPFASLALGLDTFANHFYAGGFHPAGFALTLGVRRRLWDRLAPADRAMVEAIAAHEHRLALAEALSNDARALEILGGARGVSLHPWPAALGRALATVSADRIAELARSSPLAGRIAASHARARGMRRALA